MHLVRFWHKADISRLGSNIRFWGNSRRQPNEFDSRRIDVGDPNHFAPLRDFVSDERAKVGRRTTQRCTAEIGESLFYLWIGEDGVNLMIELVDDCCWRFPWRTDSVPNRGLERTNSATAGTSGRASERVALVTASARSLPARMFAIARGIGGKAHWTWPLSRSGTKLPLYGTWTRSTPAIILNSSAFTLGPVP